MLALCPEPQPSSTARHWAPAQRTAGPWVGFHRSTARFSGKGSHSPPTPALPGAACPTAQAARGPSVGTSRDGEPAALGSSASTSVSMSEHCPEPQPAQHCKELLGEQEANRPHKFCLHLLTV